MFPRCCVPCHCDVIKYNGLLPEQLRCQYRVCVRVCVFACVRGCLAVLKPELLAGGFVAVI
jgi:hypothetical protein